jgi:hypothetical protein
MVMEALSRMMSATVDMGLLDGFTMGMRIVEGNGYDALVVYK